eukprot:1156988-Pelagomonas_calceolata.AAC.2
MHHSWHGVIATLAIFTILCARVSRCYPRCIHSVLASSPVQTAPDHSPSLLLDKLENLILIRQHSCPASTGMASSVFAAANDARSSKESFHEARAQE